MDSFSQRPRAISQRPHAASQHPSGQPRQSHSSILQRSRISRRRLLGGAAAGLIFWGATAAPALADEGASYRVQPGDTLTQIARRSGLSIADLIAVNRLPNPNFIWAGQYLMLIAPRDLPAAGGSRLISAPFISQLDGSAYADSNCGPASLAMALGALGIKTRPLELRLLANRQMGRSVPSDGTTWESLAFAAQTRGADTTGLYDQHGYRAWSIDDLASEINNGHPVLLLVRYRSLPGHTTSRYFGDHYIVGLGFNDDGDLIYHDPAYPGDLGAKRSITRAQLQQAWSSTSVGLVRTALAFQPL